MKQTLRFAAIFIISVAFGVLLGGMATDWVLDQVQQETKLYRIELPPAKRPTEAAPQFVLDIHITDSQTGRPVQADVLLGESPTVEEEAPAEALVTVCRQAATCQVAIPGHAADHPTNVQVIAPGYERFTVVLRHNLERSRTMIMPVRLVPAQPQV